jgi:hypothetical protein
MLQKVNEKCNAVVKLNNETAGDFQIQASTSNIKLSCMILQ